MKGIDHTILREAFWSNGNESLQETWEWVCKGERVPKIWREREVLAAKEKKNEIRKGKEWRK